MNRLGYCRSDVHLRFATEICRQQAQWGVALLLVIVAGCGPAEEAAPPPIPRAVSVTSLKLTAPPDARRVSGSVSSWKTEEIGFEVAGRVAWVLEPGADIEGRVLAPDGQKITQGTALAKLENERYQLSVETAQSQVSVAQLNQKGIEVDLNQGIPADMEAAEAELALARVEFQRNRRLVEQNATARADLDRAKAQLQTAEARISTLEAKTQSTQAQLSSAVAAVKQAELGLRDSRRNLDDTTLYSSFRGQVADTHVVPGSVVSQGTPVLTVQMMDPIKVEVELSAEQSRQITRSRRIAVDVTMPDGRTSEESGYVYMIDPSADPSTRTFTLTLLLLNRKVERKLPDISDTGNQAPARTRDLWRMDFNFLPDTPEGTWFIPEGAIHQDGEGSFVWKCLNAATDQDEIPSILEVQKLRVQMGSMRVPFLGNWVFQTVTIPEGQDFDPTRNLFAGKLELGDADPDSWNGTHIVLDHQSDWMLRPGDLVSVDLSETDQEDGYYVALNAIYEESGNTWVFTVDESSEPATARRVPVTIAGGTDLQTGEWRRIVPVDADQLPEGSPIIEDGVHFLQDGQSVRVVERH